MKRSNIYEAAFEAYLQWHRLCYIAVDETRRSCLGDDYVKSLDFIVCGQDGARLLVDVKGHRFPGGPKERSRRVWECWAKHDDIDGLSRWQEQFGPTYHGLLVFNYQLADDIDPAQVAGDLWTWRGKRYVLRAVLVDDYRRVMRRRSPKWETVCLPGAAFRELAQPFHHFTNHFSERVRNDCPF